MNTVPVAVVSLALVAALLAGCGGKPSQDGAKSAKSSSGSKYDSGPRAGDTPFDHEQAEEGKELFSAKGCTACHAFGRRVTGPDLAGVTKRRTAEWMEHQILEPEVMTKEDPISRQLLGVYATQMPNQRLTPPEARAVIEYFKQQDQGGVAADTK